MMTSADLLDQQPDKESILEDLGPVSSDVGKRESKTEVAQHSRFADTTGLCGVAVAPTGRSTCFFCNSKIPKGSTRFELIHNTRKPPRYIHASCVPQTQQNAEFAAPSEKWLQVSSQDVKYTSFHEEMVAALKCFQ